MERDQRDGRGGVEVWIAAPDGDLKRGARDHSVKLKHTTRQVGRHPAALLQHHPRPLLNGQIVGAD